MLSCEVNESIFFSNCKRELRDDCYSNMMHVYYARIVDALLTTFFWMLKKSIVQKNLC